MPSLNTDARENEITKVARDPEQVALLRADLQNLIRGEVFRGSPRSCQFLLHVVEKSIEGDFESLKERVIGIELFRRSASYDKGEDAIVRVTASEVRKRLLQHYRQHGDGSKFRIDLPPGSYIPEITFAPLVGSIPHVDNALPKPDAAELTLSTAASQAGVHSSFHAAWFAYSVPVLLFVVAASFWAGYRAHKTQTPPAVPAVLPWSAILGAGRTLQIIGSDPDFATEQDIDGHAISFSEYANGKYIPDGSSTFSPEMRSFCLRYLRGGRSADVDLPIVADIVSLAKPSAQKVSIRSARLMRVADFHSDDDFILLGSPLSDPWSEMFSDQLDFKITYANNSSLEEVENVRPRGNELKMYTPVSGGFGVPPPTGTSYAIVAFVQNPHQLGHVLILAGTTGAESTAAAAQLLMNVSELPNVLRHCNSSSNEPLKYFELLLKINIMAHSAINTEVVACHWLPSK